MGGVPADGVIAKTLADDMGQRVVGWLSEAGNVPSLVGFVADRQHANINNALSYAQDQAKAALAIGKLLVNTYSTYTEQLTKQDTLAKLTNQDLVFFNWKFDTSDSAQSHCSNSSLESLVDDGYDTLLNMADIGYQKHKIGHIRHRSYYGVVPCLNLYPITPRWCYCSWLTRDSEKSFRFHGQIPDNYYQMVINYTDTDMTVGKYNVKTRDVQLR